MQYEILKEGPPGVFTDVESTFDDQGDPLTVQTHLSDLQAEDGVCRAASAKLA